MGFYCHFAGFEESVGDTIVMSAATPEHLLKVGLIDMVENDAGYYILSQRYLLIHN